jgi:hypothetical protein
MNSDLLVEWEGQLELPPEKTNLFPTPEQIRKEKRNRNQAYQALDYLLSLTTWYDFFSIDTFQVFLDAQHIGQLAQKEIITSDFFLLSFTQEKQSLKKILSDYQITQESFIFLKNQEISLSKRSPNVFFSLFPNFTEKIFKKEELLPYSAEVLILLEKASENAWLRFHTPILTPEILLITALEEKTSVMYETIRHFLPDELDFYLLRFRLLKQVYAEENIVKHHLPVNYGYFAYLLKSQLSSFEFERLRENRLHFPGIRFFRNHLIHQIVGYNIRKRIQKDVYQDCSFSQRHYKRLR